MYVFQAMAFIYCLSQSKLKPIYTVYVVKGFFILIQNIDPPLLFLYLQGNATLHLYPHFEPLRQIEGKICFILNKLQSCDKNSVSGLFIPSNHIARGSRNLTSFIVIYLYLDIIY